MSSTYQSQGRSRGYGRGKYQQRKTHTVPGSRNTATIAPSTNEEPQSQPMNNGVYTNPELLHVFCRYVLGNVSQLTTVDEQVITGCIQAVSPECEIGLSVVGGGQQLQQTNRQHNGHSHHSLAQLPVIPLQEVKFITILDVNKDDCVKAVAAPCPAPGHQLLTDDQIAQRSTAKPATRPPTQLNSAEAVSLKPYFETTEGVIEESLSTTEDKGGRDQNGVGGSSFAPETMFEVNKQKFNLISTYKDDLRDYTIPVDTSGADFPARLARANQVAREISASATSRRAAQLENRSDESEEAQFSSVQRPTEAARVSPSAAAARPATPPQPAAAEETTRAESPTSPSLSPDSPHPAQMGTADSHPESGCTGGHPQPVSGMGSGTVAGIVLNPQAPEFKPRDMQVQEDATLPLSTAPMPMYPPLMIPFQGPPAQSCIVLAPPLPASSNQFPKPNALPPNVGGGGRYVGSHHHHPPPHVAPHPRPLDMPQQPQPMPLFGGQTMLQPHPNNFIHMFMSPFPAGGFQPPPAHQPIHPSAHVPQHQAPMYYIAGGPPISHPYHYAMPPTHPHTQALFSPQMVAPTPAYYGPPGAGTFVPTPQASVPGGGHFVPSVPGPHLFHPSMVPPPNAHVFLPPSHASAYLFQQPQASIDPNQQMGGSQQ